MMDTDELEHKRRQEILDAAEIVFAERGLANARMDDIVRQSGLSKGTLYWYYASKDEIIHALLDRIFVGELAQAESLLEAEGTAAERIDGFLQLVIQEIRRFEDLMPLAYEFFSLTARSEKAKNRLQSYYRRYLRLLTVLVQQGIDRGEFRTVEAEVAAQAVAGLFEGVAFYWFLDPASVDWDRIQGVGVSLMLDGLRPRRRRPRGGVHD